MRLVLQRVSRARVEVDGERVGAIGRGLVVLVGVAAGDRPESAEVAAEKLLHLRIFADAAGKMNLDLRQAGGSLLLVSQFTLVASLDRGRRPSFEGAAPPEVAQERFEELAQRLAAAGVRVETGRFGARMEVELANDGPVTFVLDC
ncbi:MAG: D-tyrosyl-tRNA(Tyr) deacylase [Thermoanaerobaculia bacterium]|nr:MAG: D-tyrosyl-tRNA(Tyr) deacylase [Thermoanaerobaculia bacterium]MBZ0102824.1 D-tyrosyl-tRNA(Tyr) deacylase [Thermoanaerobaculia bacterium]